MVKGYIKSETSVHFMHYHFIWCPKYRRKVLWGAVEVRFRELLKEKITQLQCEIKALEIMPDHIHIFIQANPKLAPNYIVAQLKGSTSNILRKEFPELRKIPTLWTRSYFVSTHGHISNEMIQKYIEEQKGQ